MDIEHQGTKGIGNKQQIFISEGERGYLLIHKKENKHVEKL